MRHPVRAARDAYRAAIARTVAASAALEGTEPGTALFKAASADLARCMQAEMQAGRDLVATMDAMRSDARYRRRGRQGAQRLGRPATPTKRSR